MLYGMEMLLSLGLVCRVGEKVLFGIGSFGILCGMNKYELVVVLPGDATVAKKKAVGESLEKLVKILKGKIEKVIDWGKKDLAYEIEKNTSGVFLIFELELSPEAVRAMPDKLRLNEQIIRYLLVKKEE